MSSVLVWKKEPVSPHSYDEASLLDPSFYQTPLEQYEKFEVDIAACESKAEVASHILENLENLMDLDELIKEENLLLDDEMLPILDDVEHTSIIPVPFQNLKSEYVKVPDTEYLLKEFETVYDVVELSHYTLTPPQSPPGRKAALINLELLPTPEVGTVISSDETTNCSVSENQDLESKYCDTIAITEFHYQPGVTSQPDVDQELVDVDELIRTRVEDMQNSCSNPGSPGSSSCSNFDDSSSSSSTDDPEWVPESTETSNVTPVKTSRKRSKPCSRGPPEEKKVRKKEQNKNAATRYRLKKKAEVEEILTEEKQLLEIQSELGNKVTDIEREIKYLKGLMRDLFKAKGLIN